MSCLTLVFLAMSLARRRFLRSFFSLSGGLHTLAREVAQVLVDNGFTRLEQLRYGAHPREWDEIEALSAGELEFLAKMRMAKRPRTTCVPVPVWISGDL